MPKDIPQWLGWLKIVPLALIAFALYWLWSSQLGVVWKVLLTPLTIIGIGFVYNTVIGLPLAAYYLRKLEGADFSQQQFDEQAIKYQGSIEQLNDMETERSGLSCPRLHAYNKRFDEIQREKANPPQGHP